MTLLQAILLGIVQGLTEFIPVSSSGHLVLVPHLLGWEFDHSQAFVFDVLVQWGTLFAVFLYYRKDLTIIALDFFRTLIKGTPFSTENSRMGWYLILATIPAVIVGLLCKDLIKSAFSNAKVTGFFLLLTAALLIIAEIAGKRNRSTKEITWLDSLWIGCAQVLALLPGVSRSGSTIAGGMIRNLDRSSAARFSFLMSVPVMLGAGLLAFKDLFAMQATGDFLLSLGVGFIAALVSGYMAIHWLIAYLNKHSLYIFAAYCSLLGVTILLF